MVLTHSLHTSWTTRWLTILPPWMHSWTKSLAHPWLRPSRKSTTCSRLWTRTSRRAKSKRGRRSSLGTGSTMPRKCVRGNMPWTKSRPNHISRWRTCETEYSLPLTRCTESTWSLLLRCLCTIPLRRLSK